MGIAQYWNFHLYAMRRHPSGPGRSHFQGEKFKARSMGRTASGTHGGSRQSACQIEVRSSRSCLLPKASGKRSTVCFQFNFSVGLKIFFSVLLEQWIRSKYMREEFINEINLPYLSGRLESTLMKKRKRDAKYFPRRFVLSQTEGVVSYFVGEVIEGLLLYCLD